MERKSIGKAGAPPGSVSRLKARDLVLAAAGPGSTRCGARAAGVTLTRLALAAGQPGPKTP